MITFERTRSCELIRAILTHPQIYDHISDDLSPGAEDYIPIESEAIWYVLARNNGEPFALWLFVPQNGITWEVHTAVLPSAWGELGLEAARLLPDWIWSHTPCRRIITNVPSTNRLALRFALNAGMQIFGVNRASYLKDGKLCDQVCLGLSPSHEEEVDQCPQPSLYQQRSV